MAQGDMTNLSTRRVPGYGPEYHGADPQVPCRKLTAGCLFSGMGGFAAGLIDAGFTIRWANDNDKSACAAFRHRFPEVTVVEDDVRRLSVQRHDLASVDVLAAGFPCQSFSQAGGRRGFDDPRGRLFFEIPRLLKEFEPRHRPPLVVLENVPYLLYGEGRTWFDQVQRELRKVGYWFRKESCWPVNVIEHTDLPQDRERLFLAAASRNRFSYNPFVSRFKNGRQRPMTRSLDDIVDRTKRGSRDLYLPSENRYFKMIYRAMENGDDPANLYQLRRSYVREKKNRLCPTLTANMGIGGHNVPFLRDSWGIRRLSVAEVARLQGFDTEDSIFPEIPETEQYRLLGNAVCVQLARLIAGKCVEILHNNDMEVS